MSTIVLTGGGTAGHCTPHLAVIPHLKKYFDTIYYIGSYNGIEKDIIEKAGIEYFGVSTVKLNRKICLENLSIPRKLIKGVKESGKLLDRLQPSIIFSKGGFVALPVVIAGKKRNIPIVCHESDLTIGLANKISSKFCARVITSFPETAKTIKNGEYVGSPIRNFADSEKQNASSKFGFKGEKPVLLALGGSSGATFINELLRASLNDLLPNFDIVHIVGKNNLAKITKPGYYQCEYLSDIETAYAICSVCLSRAGSNTVFELLSQNVPTLLIPLPKGVSRGDQVDNAEYFERLGLVYVLEQNKATRQSLSLYLSAIYANRFNVKRNIKNANIIDASEKIARIIADLKR